MLPPSILFNGLLDGFLPVRSRLRRVVDFLLPAVDAILVSKVFGTLPTKSTTLNLKVKHTKGTSNTSVYPLAPQHKNHLIDTS